MASHTINGQRWPDGTSVGVYPADAWPNPSGPPGGAAVATATVSGGAAAFTGLTEGLRYVAYASGLGVRFLVQPGSVDIMRPISGTEAAAMRRNIGTPTLTDYTPSYRAGVGLTVWVPPVGINPHSSEYAAVGDGAADDYTALTNAALRGAVLKTHVNLFGDYKIAGGQLAPPEGVVLKGSGPGMTRLLQGQWASTLIKTAGTRGSAILLTADVLYPNGILLSIPTTGIAVGDTLLLSSNTLAYAGSGTAKHGEMVRVREIVSGTQVKLWGPVRDDYTVANAAQVQKLTMKRGNGLTDLTVENLEPGQHFTSMIDFTCCLEPSVDVHLIGGDSTGVIFNDCFDFDADVHLRDFVDQVNGTPTPRFGYGVAVTNSSELGSVRVHSRRGRHAFTTLTDGTRGISRTVRVTGAARDHTGIPFDTHPGCEDILFEAIDVSGCSHAAVSLRGINNRCLSGAISHCAGGVWISGPAHGAVVKGVSMKHLGGFQTWDGELHDNPDGDGYGVSWIASNDGGAEGVVIEDNAMEHLLRAGVSFSSGGSPNYPVKRARILRNDIINPGQVGSTGYGVQFQGTVTDIVDTLIERNLIVDYSATGLEPDTSGALTDGIRVDSAAVTSLRIADNDVDGASGAHVGGARAGDAGITRRSNRREGLPVDKYIQVTAAATIALPYDAEVVQVNGNTNITAITASWAGRRVTLFFQGTPTVSDAGNINLNAAFVATANDTLTLVSDGTNWIEAGRSVN